MYVTQVMHSLFNSGGESHSYDEIKTWCESNLGVSENQVKGIVGSLVREKMIYLTEHATETHSAIFTR